MKVTLDCKIGRVERGQTISLPRGENLHLTASVLDENGQVQDLSGGNVRLRIMQVSTRLAEYTLTSTAQQALLGICEADISLNRSVDANTYWFDVWFTSASGDKSRVYPATAFVVLESSSA